MSTHSTPDWKAEIAAREAQANTAFLNRDLEQLDRLFSDDLLVNSPLNRINDKKKLLELLGSGVIGHVSTEVQHELIRRDGDIVIVMGSDEVRNAESEPVIRRRFTNIWRKESDGWRLFVRQATVIPDNG